MTGKLTAGLIASLVLTHNYFVPTVTPSLQPFLIIDARPHYPVEIPALVLRVAQEDPAFPADIAMTIAARESGFNPNAKNLNDNGTWDWGVMQINDTALKSLGVVHPLDPVENVTAGVHYLQRLYFIFSGDPEEVRRMKVECVYALGAGGCAKKLGMASER